MDPQSTKRAAARAVLLTAALVAALAVLSPTPVVADGIEVLAPARPAYPLGQATETRYRFTEPYDEDPTRVRVFLHHQAHGTDAMGLWIELWHWQTGDPATVDADGIVTVPITIPESIALGDDYVVSVIVSENLWGSIGPFEVVSHFGDTGSSGIGGDAVLLLYPRGGESWQRGGQYSILWEMHGFGLAEHPMPQAAVQIEFLRSGRGLDRFQPPPSGWNRLECDPDNHLCSAAWKIPDEPERYDGDDITVRVTARAPDSSLRRSDESEPFSIRVGGIYLVEPDRRWPNLLDTEGFRREEETLYVSHDLNIRWQVKPHSLGSLPTRIHLLDAAGATVHTLGRVSTASTGVGDWIWEIGRPETSSPEELTVPPGSGYRLRIERDDDVSIWDESASFTIATPSIAIETPTRPADGLLTSNEFYADEEMEIEWTAENLTASQRVDVVVEIEEHGCPDRHRATASVLVAADLPAMAGSVSWEIGSALYEVGYSP